MKLYIKTNKSGMITESSLVAYDKKEKAEVIDVNEEQLRLIREQHDTIVENGEIVEQKEWKNAKNFKTRIANIEKNENDKRMKEEQESESKPTE